MAYAQGDLILDDHYNTFATGSASGTADHNVANINTVWGVGNGNKGYGQSTTLTAVTAGDIVTATQWSTLIARLNSVLTHQAGSGSGISSPTSGSLISYLSTLSGKVTDAYNNRANFNNTRSAVVSDTARSTSWNTAAPTTYTQVRTVTFQDADKMRYFFNAGGRLQLKFNATGSAGTTKETNWTGLINSALTAINLDYTTSSRTGTGETLTTDGGTNGFWDLTTTDTKLIRLTQDTSPYTGSFIDVWAKVAGTAGSNGGLGTDIVFTVTYTDDGSSTFNDNINIALDTRVDIYKPETSNLTDVWGTISVASTTN